MLQQDTEKTTFKTLADIADKEPNAFAIVPFLNVYESKDSTERSLIVDANGGYHKAVLSDSVTDADPVFNYSKQQSAISGEEFSVNPQDCTQLIRADKVYQITDETVSDEQIGEYLDVIAQTIVFDRETKMEISKEDLSKIDWNGKGSSSSSVKAGSMARCTRFRMRTYPIPLRLKLTRNTGLQPAIINKKANKHIK